MVDLSIVFCMFTRGYPGRTESLKWEFLKMGDPQYQRIRTSHFPYGNGDLDLFGGFWRYPLVNVHINYGKSPFLVGKSTVNQL